MRCHCQLVSSSGDGCWRPQASSLYTAIVMRPLGAVTAFETCCGYPQGSTGSVLGGQDACLHDLVILIGAQAQPRSEMLYGGPFAISVANFTQHFLDSQFVQPSASRSGHPEWSQVTSVVFWCEVHDRIPGTYSPTLHRTLAVDDHRNRNSTALLEKQVLRL
jgi:hypothetical protein